MICIGDRARRQARNVSRSRGRRETRGRAAVGENSGYGELIFIKVAAATGKIQGWVVGRVKSVLGEGLDFRELGGMVEVVVEEAVG